MTFNEFNKKVEEAATIFRTVPKYETIRVVSHLDADGICSAALILNALKRENYKYSLSIVRQLSEDILSDLKNEDYNYFIFTDLGSGQYDLIKKYLGTKNIMILDHHSFNLDIMKTIPKNIIMLNPHLCDIDGSSDISGSGVVYLFTVALNKNNKNMAHLAIIGAIGDIQENNGFTGLNKEILEDAISNNKIKVEQSLKWFGIETKPLYKLLLYGSGIDIPGLTGSESNVIQFLKNLKIEPKIGNKWLRYDDLSDDKKKKLTSAIVMKRSNKERPENILGKRYLLVDEQSGTPFKDAKEFSTLLNACGRMNKASYGIGACLNNKESKRKALNTLSKYRHEIVTALRWYENSPDAIKGENYLILNAKDKVLSTVIGTLASIISKNNNLKEGTLILSLAREPKGITKVSLRMVGDNPKVDLRDAINSIIEQTNSGESGGHKNAAGAIIKTENEDSFIKEAVKLFNSLAV